MTSIPQHQSGLKAKYIISPGQRPGNDTNNQNIRPVRAKYKYCPFRAYIISHHPATGALPRADVITPLRG
ncbi:MAG: hypothetical protein VB102_14130 [Paludibacter sp.]|nr:hypothetical protein [Paludibacter sp.]